MPGIAISADHLTKRFGKFTAVDEVSFEIPYGAIFGFLGANGAGKSTTIRMLCGILGPTSGNGQVGGFDVQTQPEQIKTVIGYVSQRFSLYSDLNVVENLSFYGQIYGIEGAVLSDRIKEVLALTGLEPFRQRLAGDLGQPATLRHQLKDQILEVACQPLMKASRLFLTLEGVRGVTVYGTTLNLNVTDQKAAEPLVIAAAKKEGVTISSIKSIEASLEDVFSDLDSRTKKKDA